MQKTPSVNNFYEKCTQAVIFTADYFNICYFRELESPPTEAIQLGNLNVANNQPHRGAHHPRVNHDESSPIVRLYTPTPLHIHGSSTLRPALRETPSCPSFGHPVATPIAQHRAPIPRAQHQVPVPRAHDQESTPVIHHRPPIPIAQHGAPTPRAQHQKPTPISHDQEYPIAQYGAHTPRAQHQVPTPRVQHQVPVPRAHDQEYTPIAQHGAHTPRAQHQVPTPRVQHQVPAPRAHDQEYTPVVHHHASTPIAQHGAHTPRAQHRVPTPIVQHEMQVSRAHDQEYTPIVQHGAPQHQVPNPIAQHQWPYEIDQWRGPPEYSRQNYLATPPEPQRGYPPNLYGSDRRCFQFEDAVRIAEMTSQENAIAVYKARCDEYRERDLMATIQSNSRNVARKYFGI